jgi:hypothetical protein
MSLHLPTIIVPNFCMICVLQYLDISPHPAHYFAQTRNFLYKCKPGCVKQQQRC